MIPTLTLPRLVFGAAAHNEIKNELTLLGVMRPLLITDNGLHRAGIDALLLAVMPKTTQCFRDVPENPTAAGADAAYAAYMAHGCDAVVALGGGSVLDTAKIVAAMAGCGLDQAAALLPRVELITRHIAPLLALPTTLGTGSESSPVAALHPQGHLPAIATRSPFLVPRVAICDPGLTRSLPPRLVAATGIDALSHCLEGFFATPATPIIDALALDGLGRAFRHIESAMLPGGEAARAELMAAAFAGGAAIHKGLGPAHAVAIAFGDQGLHHGALIAAALPLTTALLAANAPAKAAQVAAVLGLGSAAEIAPALAALIARLNLPSNLRAAGYQPRPVAGLAAQMAASHFNRTSPYPPSLDEYAAIAMRLLA